MQKNICTLFSNFESNPLHVLITNNCFKDFVKHDTALIEILDNCNVIEITDTTEELIRFADIILKAGKTSIIKSSYFNFWKLKLDSKFFNGSKENVFLLENCIYNLANKEFCDKTIVPSYFDSFLKCVKNNLSTVNENVKFSSSTSWKLINNLTEEEISSIALSLCVTDVEKNYNSALALKLAKIINSFDLKDVGWFLNKINSDNPSLLFDLAKNNKIVLENINFKLSNVFFDKTVSENNRVLLNIFATKPNSSTAIEYSKKTKDFNITNVFYKEDGSLVKNVDFEIINYYICNKDIRNFDTVKDIVLKLDEQYFIDKTNWKAFLDSFCETAMYYCVNQNNLEILTRLVEKKIISKLDLLKSKNLYKIKN